MLRTIRVACLPRDLPDLITVDVSHLEIGHSVHVSELKLPAGVTAGNPPELPVFSVFAPKEETVETPAAESRAAPRSSRRRRTDEAAPADAKGRQGRCEGCGSQGRRKEIDRAVAERPISS